MRISSTARSIAVFVLLALGVPFIGVACRKKPALDRDRCNAIADQALTAVASARTNANIHAACSADTDCIEAHGAKCIAGGCGGYAIPKGQNGSFAAAVASVESNDCARWTEGDCATIAPRPMASCAPYRVRCDANHHCRMSVPIALEADECEELYNAARKALTSATARADTSCTKDEDCIQSETTPRCFGGCAGYAVSKKGTANLAKDIAAIDQTTCKPWVDGNCPSTTPKPVPSCAPMAAKCKQGRCTNVLALPPP